jgi:hypothetical protein
VSDSAAAEALRVAGLGTLEGDHAWLDAEALKAAGDGSSGWTVYFYAMLAYAKTRGWTNDGESRIRAHVIRT